MTRKEKKIQVVISIWRILLWIKVIVQSKGEFVIKKSVVDKIGLAKLYETKLSMNLSESNIKCFNNQEI